MKTSALGLGILALLLSACSSAGSGGGTTDARVRSLAGTVPPEIGGQGAWLNVQPTSLASLRGQVVFVQFAFPT